MTLANQESVREPGNGGTDGSGQRPTDGLGLGVLLVSSQANPLLRRPE